MVGVPWENTMIPPLPDAKIAMVAHTPPQIMPQYVHLVPRDIILMTKLRIVKHATKENIPLQVRILVPTVRLVHLQVPLGQLRVPRAPLVHMLLRKNRLLVLIVQPGSILPLALLLARR